MRRIFAFLIASGTVTAVGCGSESGSAPNYVGSDPTEACAAAVARVKECRYDPASSPYSDSIGDRCYDECIANCVAAAPCADLAPLEGAWGDGCPPRDTTGNCVTGCLGGCNTPLVLAFDAAPVRFEQSPGTFDFGTGAPIATDWPSPATPWLALDRNGNGSIDDAGELFGSATPLDAGGRGKNGFVPLAELDANGDGQITPADDAWGELLLWSDRDGDRRSSPGELVPLSRAGVTSVDLAYIREPRCDGRGNCEVERARFRFQGAGAIEREGTLIDVHLREQSDRSAPPR